MTAFAGGVRASGQTNTQITTTSNGTLMVNIAGPSAGGVSHNKYTDYNVDKGGLVLNNSTEEGNSKLGGRVLGNGNLGGNSASVILNEVTSTNRSVLQGYTEVFGSSAAVVVANPNGITCDGCGFINSPDVTLTTGRPKMGANGIEGYDVSQGKITIGRGGADLYGVNNFNLFSRQVHIDGNMTRGKNINVTAGPNFIDYKTGKVVSTKQLADKVNFAISSSSFGGMYGDRITMLSTEKGVGVNMQGDMASHAGNLLITADGNIAIKKNFAQNNVKIHSQSGGVHLQGDTQNNEYNIQRGNVDINAAGHIRVDSLFETRENVTIQSRNAGISINNTIHAGGNFELTAQGDLDNNGQIAAIGKFDLTARNVNNNGTIQSGSIFTLNATGTVDTKGNITYVDASNINATSLSNSGNIMGYSRVAGDLNITLSQGSLTNNGNISHYAGAMNLIVPGNLHNNIKVIYGTSDEGQTIYQSGSYIRAVGGLNIQAGENLSNAGYIITGAMLNIRARNLINSGNIQSDDALKLALSGSLDNQGNIYYKNGAQITTTSVSNTGSISSLNGASNAALSMDV